MAIKIYLCNIFLLAPIQPSEDVDSALDAVSEEELINCLVRETSTQRHHTVLKEQTNLASLGHCLFFVSGLQIMQPQGEL